MSHLGVRLAALLVAVLLPGCPFELKVPLGAPQPRQRDDRLVGDWVWEDKAGKQDSTLVAILPFNESEYLIELTEDDKKPGRFRAFEVEIGDQVFWNINMVDTAFPPKSYCFARTTLRDDGRLSVRWVGGKGVPKAFESDADGLVAFLKSHSSDPALDDTDGASVWRRPLSGEIEKGRLKSWSSRTAPDAASSGR
ncbi:MAG: hypothetical protein EXS13_06220 [Planctomycetes bacterium]|nr:hypothetical protein [Planctomycetota bacterium]